MGISTEAEESISGLQSIPKSISQEATWFYGGNGVKTDKIYQIPYFGQRSTARNQKARYQNQIFYFLKSSSYVDIARYPKFYQTPKTRETGSLSVEIVFNAFFLVPPVGPLYHQSGHEFWEMISDRDLRTKTDLDP